tara:strand:+ start:499 stop:3444 length:2946 start_codon:yes stop_codon:yes gene_type:complete
MSIVNAGFFHAKQELPFTRKFGQNKDFQKGLRFDGTSSFITFTPTNVQSYASAPTSYTASFYLRRGGGGMSPAGGAKQTILWAGDDSDNYEELYFDHRNNLVYKYVVGGVTGGAIYTQGEQYKVSSVQRHVAISLERSGSTLLLRIDGTGFTTGVNMGTATGYICKQNATHFIGKSGADTDCFFNGIISRVHIHEFTEVDEEETINGPQHAAGFNVMGLAPILDYRSQNLGNANPYIAETHFHKILHYPSRGLTFNSVHDNDILLRFLDSSNLNKDSSREESLAVDNDADTINDNSSMVSLSNIIAGRDDTLDTPFNSFCILDWNTGPDGLGGFLNIVQNETTIREGGVQFRNFHSSTPQFNGVDVTDNFSICGCYGLTKGKWYWEWRTSGTNSKTYYGFASNNTVSGCVIPDEDLGGSTNDGYVWDEAGNFYNGGTVTNNAVDPLGAGNIFSIHLDLDNNTARFRRNNGSEFTIPTAAQTSMANADVFWPVVGGSITAAGTSQGNLNFGADSSFAGALTNRNNETDSNGFGDFRYRPDDGYLAICLPNLPEPAFPQSNAEHNQQHFNSDVIISASSNASVPSSAGLTVGVLADLVIYKNFLASTGTTHWLLYDTLRPESKDMINRLELSNTSAEGQQGSSSISTENLLAGSGVRQVLRGAFDSAIRGQIGGTETRTLFAGWSMVDHTIPDATGSFQNFGTGGVLNGQSNATFTGNNTVPTPSVPTAQTSGMNAEQYLNSKAQQTMIKYTGVAGQAEVDHGLDGAPEFFMVKKYSASGTNWKFWHKSLGAQGIGEMNTSSGTLTNDTTHWSSSGQNFLDSGGGALRRIRFVGNNTSVNATGESHILYAWRGVEGYSRFGQYTCDDVTGGNHHPFVWCGFRPKLLWIKRADGFACRWQVIEATSKGGELTEMRLEINNAVATEDSENINNQDDQHGHFIYMYNEGFRVKAGNSFVRADGVKYIFCAWANEDRKYGNFYQSTI